MAIWRRGDDYTERLADAGAVCSVGSRGDRYDNALAESIIGLYKTDLIHRRRPWNGLDDVEIATMEWVDWYNNRRLHSACNDPPPAEFETRYPTQIDPDILTPAS
ncbi:integrase core domain-containing protein [Microbispora sp. GKU 823]|uniref:integrase core domain-containing protein n=1 Tax=Microbispora sp. GKU 823 TaxID=1652100 RepID=UPI0009A32F4A|nr:hypothetical protein B1L11_13995 [Microbispora sp. GKU 823]